MASLYEIQYRAFDIIVWISYITYGLLMIGFLNTSPKYLEYLNYGVKIYVSLFLLWRFNMFQKVRFSELDRKIAFSAGMFLITTTAIDTIIRGYLNKLSNIMK
jgi:cytochrome c biogenesis protein CcdA